MIYGIIGIIDLVIILILKFIFPSLSTQLKSIFGIKKIQKSHLEGNVKNTNFILYNINYFLWIFITIYLIGLSLFMTSVMFMVLSIISLVIFPVGQRTLGYLLSKTSWGSLTSNKLLVPFIIGGSTVFILSCVVMIIVLISSKTYFSHIDDINGDINELNTIVLGDSIEGEISSVRLGTSYTYDGDSTGVSNGNLTNPFDYDYLDFTVKKISGILIINSSLVKDNEVLNLNINSSLYDGNCILIVVDGDWEIIDSLPINEETTYSITANVDTVIRIAIVGESADVEVEIRRDVTPAN